MIDILLSTYNGQKYLKEQLDSLLSQTYQDFKIILRDDGSTDNTLEIITNYIHNYPEKFLLLDNKNTNLGSTNSFFYLLKNSSSEFIMFCDQDDVWNNNKLEIFLEYYNRYVSDKTKPVLIHSAADVVDSNLNKLNQATQLFNKYKDGMKHTLIWQIFQNDVTGCTLMINAAMRNIVNKIDFSQHKVIQHDWFLAQIAYCYNSKYYIPEKTIKYRQHAGNVIGVKNISLFERIKRKTKTKKSYPYYEQIETLLLCNVELNIETKKLLTTFASLKSKNKITRIFFHLRNNFLREDNLFFKIYQLSIC